MKVWRACFALASLMFSFARMTLADEAMAIGERFAEIERIYRLKVIVETPAISVRVNGGEIAGAQASADDIERYAPLLLAEFPRYPAKLVEAARVSRIVLCRDLSFAAQLRAAIPDFEHDTLYLDVLRGAGEVAAGGGEGAADRKGEYQRLVLHHEFFHLFDYWDDGKLLEDDDWSRLNPAGFAYGAGGETAQDDPTTSLPSDKYPGFLNHYSTTSVAEDKAEIFASLMVDYVGLMRRADGDGVLQGKMERMKVILASSCPEIDDAFWLAAAGNRPGK